MRLGLTGGDRLAFADQFQPVRGGVDPIPWQNLEGLVDGGQKTRRIAVEATGKGLVRISIAVLYSGQPTLIFGRRVARDDVIKSRAKRIKVRIRSLRRPGQIEFRRGIVALHDRAGRARATVVRQRFAGRAEIDQDRPLVRVDHDIVRRNIAVQHASLMEELHRAQALLQHFDDLVRHEGVIRGVQILPQIFAVGMVDCHVDGFIILKDLMHADDIRMDQICHLVRLSQEQANNGTVLILIGGGAGAHDGFAASADGVWKALLDHDRAVESVLGEIAYVEPAAVEEVDDRVLTVG